MSLINYLLAAIVGGLFGTLEYLQRKHSESPVAEAKATDGTFREEPTMFLRWYRVPGFKPRLQQKWRWTCARGHVVDIGDEEWRDVPEEMFDA